MLLEYLMMCLFIFGTICDNPASYKHNGIDGIVSNKVALEIYYSDSPYSFLGYATRFGSNEFAEEVMWNHFSEMIDQLDHSDGYSLLGGGAGYVNIAGREYLLQNRASVAWSKIVYGEFPDDWKMTSSQSRLIDLAYAENLKKFDRNRFIRNLHERYVGIIATKSPNDFGIEYCLQSIDNKIVGRVIVGDFARQNDWIPSSENINVSLSQRLYTDDKNFSWHWAADLPNDLYYKLLNYIEPNVTLITLMPVEYCGD